MLVEFKCETSQKELRRLTDEVEKKQHQLMRLQESSKTLSQIGFTADDVSISIHYC